VSVLPRISGREVVAAFRKLSYEVDRQRGSHIILRHAQPPHRRLTIPDHREVGKGTLRALIREAGISVEEFIGLDAGIHHIGGSRAEDYFSLRASREIYQESEVRIPLDLLWIMDDPFGNAICLGIAGASRGKIFFWDHEVPPTLDDWDGRVDSAENVQLLANSFTEFVSGLHPNES
jgi:predicted RNA binding protein YcfA (HicA-like mRNA interferase family)